MFLCALFSFSFAPSETVPAYFVECFESDNIYSSDWHGELRGAMPIGEQIAT